MTTHLTINKHDDPNRVAIEIREGRYIKKRLLLTRSEYRELVHTIAVMERLEDVKVPYKEGGKER